MSPNPTRMAADLSRRPASMTVPIFKGNGIIEYESIPTPHVEAADDVCIMVEACGICGTDLNLLAVPPAHKATHGIVIGHEAVGRVIETAVDDLAIGTRVVVAPRITCGRCRYCRRGLDNQCSDYRTVGTTRQGAFAPYLCLPRRALFAISEALPLDDALFFEPLSCAVGAYDRTPFMAGDHVAIIGAGPMGLLFALLYRSAGAGLITLVDVSPARLDAARALNIGTVIDARATDVAQAIHNAGGDSDGIGADIVVDAVGNQIATAIESVRRGGSVILFGLRPDEKPSVSQYRITRYDITVRGTFVGLHPFVATIAMLERATIRPSVLISHRLGLTQLKQGVELMRSGAATKVIINPTVDRLSIPEEV